MNNLQLGIFCYIKDEVNVILPFYNVAVWISEESKDEIANLVTTKVDLSLLFKFRKLGIKTLYQEIGKFEVEKYGVESAYYRSTNYLCNLGKALVSNCNPKFNKFSAVNYIENYLSHPELAIGYAFSKLMRESRMAFYSKHYPYLNIKKHKGKLTKEHLNTLLELHSLPYFYNESFLINYVLSNNLKSKWAELYIKNHYDLIK